MSRVSVGECPESDASQTALPGIGPARPGQARNTLSQAAEVGGRWGQATPRMPYDELESCRSDVRVTSSSTGRA